MVIITDPAVAQPDFAHASDVLTTASQNSMVSHPNSGALMPHQNL